MLLTSFRLIRNCLISMLLGNMVPDKPGWQLFADESNKVKLSNHYSRDIEPICSHHPLVFALRVTSIKLFFPFDIIMYYLLGYRVPCLFPFFQAANHVDGILVSHVVQCFGRQRTSEVESAVDDDFGTPVGYHHCYFKLQHPP
jgi:hypothetical protein